MGANFGASFITLSAIKAGSPWERLGSLACPSQELLPPFTSNEVKGKEWDQKQEHPDRPEKTPPHRVSPFLGIKKNPEGNNHQNDEKD
jgi:hypothetical protein